MNDHAMCSTKISEERPPTTLSQPALNDHEMCPALQPASAGLRLQVLDSVRGLAALAVCLFHFAGRDDFLPKSYLQVASRHGYLGVVAFFVISGFVVPWSLQKSGYRLRDFPRFMCKRLLRLEPPYLVAVASVVAFAAFYAWVKQRPFPPQESQQWWLQVALHAGYFTRFFGFDWLDDVYWTLAIEFQFYVLVGLAFPLLSAASVGVRWTTCGLMTVLGFSALVLPQKMVVVTVLPIFVLGILAYQYRSGLIRWRHYVASLAAVGVVCYLTNTGPIALTALATCLLISVTSSGWAPLNHLGAVSYSLYLFHATLGGAIINLGIKHSSTALGRYCVFLIALAAVFAAALLMYWLIERPARRWSSAIRYSPAPTSP